MGMFCVYTEATGGVTSWAPDGSVMGLTILPAVISGLAGCMYSRQCFFADDVKVADADLEKCKEVDRTQPINHNPSTKLTP